MPVLSYYSYCGYAAGEKYYCTCSETRPCVLQVKSFFAEHQDSGIERSTRVEVEQSIVRNIDWMSRSRDDIVYWLRHRQL